MFADAFLKTAAGGDLCGWESRRSVCFQQPEIYNILENLFQFSKAEMASMSYFSNYILDTLGLNFLTPHCLYWRLHETLIWPGLIKAGYHLTVGANFVILVKGVS